MLLDNQNTNYMLFAKMKRNLPLDNSGIIRNSRIIIIVRTKLTSLRSEMIIYIL